MFTIIENYKALMNMCVGARFAPNEQVVAQVEAKGQDTEGFTLQDLNSMVHEGHSEAEVLAILKSRYDIAVFDADVLNKMNGLTSQVSQTVEVAHNQGAVHAQNVYSSVPDAGTIATMPISYETVEAVPAQAVVIPAYTAENFIAPEVKTYNGQTVVELADHGLPVDESELVAGSYYKAVDGTISLFNGDCFTIVSWFVTQPASNSVIAQTYEEVCPESVCINKPVVETIPYSTPIETIPYAPEVIETVPYTPVPAPSFQEYVPYTHKAPTLTPATHLNINCNGEQVAGEFVMRMSPYDVYLAEGRILRVNQVTWKVEQRHFGINESRPTTVADIKANIQTLIQDGTIDINLLVTKIKLSDIWEYVGENENICTPIMPYQPRGGDDRTPGVNPGVNPGSPASTRTGDRKGAETWAGKTWSASGWAGWVGRGWVGKAG